METLTRSSDLLKDAEAELKTIWIEDIQAFQTIAPEWDEAVIASGEDNPFLLSDFLLCWWAHRAQDLTPAIFVLMQGKEIVGGLPLCRDKKGVLQYMGEQAANYTEFLRASPHLDIWGEFLAALEKLPRWRRLILQRVREESLECDDLTQQAYSRLLFDLAHTTDAYIIDVPRDFARFRGPSHSGLRREVGRLLRKAASLGGLSLQTAIPENDLDAAIEVFIHYSRVFFHDRGMASLFEEASMRQFFRELVHAFARNGKLDAQLLMLKDEIMAIHFGYRLGNHLNYIWVACNPHHAMLGPGHLMIYKALELAAERGDHFLDMYTGYYRYKALWSTRTLPVWRVEIRRNTLMSKLGITVLQADRSLRRYVKSNPRLYSTASACRDAFRRFSSPLQ